ncbi:Tol-Pal system beta propeller repeat protein TolB [Allohahella sp. A8]|uniref:Tol-Pal system beta propeller repeat protein TolB n=1 Tax=Allohahella sp. A8 TaxID=3141461 RepID=UPI003A80CDFC
MLNETMPKAAARITVVATLLLSLLLSAAARADLVIEITQGVKGAVPIAVVPFANETNGNLPQDPSEIITEDLRRSGDFAPLGKQNFLSLPSKGEDIFFRDWSLLGQRYLVVGALSKGDEADTLKLRYELHDVTSRKRILGRVVTGKESALRDMAHSAADAIYEALTGTKGVFSTKIAYVVLEGSNKKPIYSLEVADADGQRSKVVYKSPSPVLSPAWSPDGKKLAYVSYETGRPAIFIQDINSGVRTKTAAYQGINSAPAWSPDGRQLAMTLSKDGNPEIYTLDLGSGDLKRITNNWGIDTEANWSPDGKSLVFTSDRGGSPQIYKTDISGGGETRLTFDGRYNARPRYSMDGKSLFFVHQREGVFNVARMDLETRELDVLSGTRMDESPSVAPNGNMVIYATKDNDRGMLAVVGVTTGARYVLPSREGDVREPAWSPFL